ncbi:DUF4136 domain-containing protein [Thalassotalea agarivorans]|uniref:DUF4136 domain-containing protein n=1 Tax=Thalassotalea agarivorans TaxID=349064 RepID=A0A1I0GRQ9_THASX|nr:DUF4136 domain-containing protein [Thalassotalea agarivorans]SET72884.1 protein of unknown function [Thalassotalea agarivorans]
MKLLSSLLLLTLLSACSSSPVVFAKYQRNYDFGDIETYRFYERNSQFSDYQNLSFSFRNSIEIAIEKTLDLNGLTYVETDDSDIIVAYYIVSNSSRNFKRYNRGVRFCEYCLAAYGREDEKRTILPAYPGSLVVDLLETEHERVIWRSVGELKLEEEDNSNQVQQKVRAMIAEMFSQIPLKGK